MGPGKYEGKHVPKYQFTVCKTCYEGNWDGWSPTYEKQIISYLNENAIPIPERNSKGLLPRN